MSDESKRQVVVAGATGMVGREAVRQLAARGDVHVAALVRASGAGFPPGVHEHVFDYEQSDRYRALGAEIRCDVLLCCLGTTRAKAGSDEAFRRVDRDYPIQLIDHLKKQPRRPVVGLVSSVGAERGAGLYLGSKAAVEEALRGSGLPYVIARPSLLVGERTEKRLGERLANAVSGPLFGVLRAVTHSETVERYAPISAAEVAAALIRHTLDDHEPHLVLSGSALRAS